MSDSVDSRFAPPQALVDDVVVQGGGYQLASRGQRFLGAVIDGLVVGGLAWLLSRLPGFDFMFSSETFRLKAVALSMVLFVAVQGWLLVKHGQTIGKRALGMRIVRTDGSAADATRVLALRYGVGFVLNVVAMVGGLYGIVDALLIYRSSRQCLHDTIADTKVIKL